IEKASGQSLNAETHPIYLIWRCRGRGRVRGSGGGRFANCPNKSSPKPCGPEAPSVRKSPPISTLTSDRPEHRLKRLAYNGQVRIKKVGYRCKRHHVARIVRIGEEDVCPLIPE